MTTTELTGELCLEGDEGRYSGAWILTGETLSWELRGKDYCIESGDNLSENVSSFVKILGKKVLNDTVKLRGCMTCKNFSMSSMARDMGRGQRGVCELHSKGVEICFLCSDYVPVN